MIGKKEIILLMIHVVSAGETVASIAARYGVSEQRIRYDNQLFSFSGLVPGQALLIWRHLVKRWKGSLQGTA